ncbi:hypothetical protein [Aliivibrio logei]|uniref:Uncharacterized protein n=1 Tax=Aliivibrio logei 5S-186 TaxID=626086 RepID=A0ABX3AYN7_ALILO|nr:hypothetical protein [Aliivibrio logei]OEF19695.1 hypothetical protein A1Q5_04505 [Aliivibrio logei 5S-186]
MIIRYIILVLVFFFSFNSYARQENDYNKNIDEIQNSLEKRSNIMVFERSGQGNDIPMPENNKDKPKRSYFYIISYDIYSNLNGKRTINAFVENDSGGGIRIKSEHIKAYLSSGLYVSPRSIKQNGTFSQGEKKRVTLDFGEIESSILGLTTRTY